MEYVKKSEFDALKKQHEDLKKSHWELLDVLMKVTDGLRSLVDTERMPQNENTTKTIATRLKGHYEIFNDSYLKVSSLKFGR
jgi:uncharacterized membrane protein YukC